MATLRPQYDHLSTHDGAQSVFYIEVPGQGIIECGEFVNFELSIDGETIDVPRFGQFYVAQKVGQRTINASVTYRVGQDRSQWLRFTAGIANNGSRRIREQRFNMTIVSHDREAPELGTQIVELTGVSVASGTHPFDVTSAIQEASCELLISHIEIPRSYDQLPTGIQFV